MIKALAFISSFGFGACTAASLQVATTDNTLKISDTKEAPTVHAPSSNANRLRNRANKFKQDAHEYTRSPSIIFAIAASFYAVGLILSLPLNLLLTWQSAARAVTSGGVARAMVAMDVYISLVAVIAAALLTGQALKSIKPIVGWITLGAVGLVALTFVVIEVVVHTSPEFNDPEPRRCTWFTGV